MNIYFKFYITWSCKAVEKSNTCAKIVVRKLEKRNDQKSGLFGADW